MSLSPRTVALFAASTLPGAMDFTRRMGQGLPVDGPSLAATTAATLLLLVLLARAFDAAVTRRVSGASCFAILGVLAVLTGVAESFVGWASAGHVGLAPVPPGHDHGLVLARIGAFNGLYRLGLFAMVVALPFAASGVREAERLRATAELARLRANLQPHFLFNTLSTVSGLLGEDPEGARRLIATLGDLLRDSLVDGDEMQSLDEEIRWLKHYAAILETRHRGSLSFDWNIEDAVGQARLPRLLLQPLVENAVKHGALRRADGGVVAIRARLENEGTERVTCIIEDNGPGFSAGGTRPGGIGLDLVKRRLSLRYGTSAQVRLERGDGHTRCIVSLPAERAR